MARIIVFSTCASRGEATEIGPELLRNRLAACVNVLPIFSLYRWKGKIRSGLECLFTIKTRVGVFGKLKGQVSELSRYELAEIISV
jgi:periplasmic divalent cation tolerance protein